MKIIKANRLPTVAGDFDCYMVQHCRIRHDAVPATDELGADAGTEWFFREGRDRDRGAFDAYAWIWLRQEDGDFELKEIVLSEVAGLDPDDPVFDENLFRLVSWARGEIEERLADRDSYYFAA